MTDLSTVAKLLLSKDNIEILTHHYPDGDTLGCAYGLCMMLQQLHKNARVVTSGAVGRKYEFLKAGVKEQEFEAEFVVSVDVAAPSLLGENQQGYEEFIDLCIDHHGTNNLKAKEKYVDANAAAAAEIIFMLALELGISFTKEIANCIYTGISTDTGCFRYSNTTERTHLIAAEMMKYTDAWFDINTRMFEMKTREKIQLERMVYDTLEYACGGKCALIYTTLEMQKQAGITDDEMEGLASIPRRIENVLLGITMREKEGGVFKVSVRSNGDVDASQFCIKFGGGGHKAASGCTVEGNLESAKAKLLEAAQEFL